MREVGYGLLPVFIEDNKIAARQPSKDLAIFFNLNINSNYVCPGFKQRLIFLCAKHSRCEKGEDCSHSLIVSEN